MMSGLLLGGFRLPLMRGSDLGADLRHGVVIHLGSLRHFLRQGLKIFTLMLLTRAPS